MVIHSNLLHDKADNTAVVVACDVEGTLSAGEAWRGMRLYLEANGQGEKFKHFLRQRLFKVVLYRLGLLRNVRAFKDAWIEDMLQLFSGYSQEEMLAMGAYATEHAVWPNRRQVVVDELLAHKENGRRVILVTGVVEPILIHIAQKLGVEAIGTPLTYENDVFTGKLAAPFNTGQSKAAQLQPFLQDGKILSAYGDTGEDIPMLNICHEPVAVFPDKVLRDTAVAHNWRILEIGD